MTHEEFLHQTSLKGFDLILNTQGGKTIRQHYNRLGMTGRLVALGISSGVTAGKRNLLHFLTAAIQMPRFAIVPMFDENRGISALNALPLLGDSHYRSTLASKWESAEKLKLMPHIEKVFPASEVAQAHALLESKKARGKILLSWV